MLNHSNELKLLTTTNALQYRTVPHLTVLYSTVLYRTSQYLTVLYLTIPKLTYLTFMALMTVVPHDGVGLLDQMPDRLISQGGLAGVVYAGDTLLISVSPSHISE